MCIEPERDDQRRGTKFRDRLQARLNHFDVARIILKPAVGCELRVGFAALDNHGERLRPVRGAVAGRVGDPSGNVAVLR
jgi:hypothetical protein